MKFSFCLLIILSAFLSIAYTQSSVVNSSQIVETSSSDMMSSIESSMVGNSSSLSSIPTDNGNQPDSAFSHSIFSSLIVLLLAYLI